MSSIGSTFAQISSKVKYLLTTNTTNFYCPLNPDLEQPSFMTETEFNAEFAPPNPPYASGTLLRDLGKILIVLGSNDLEVAKYTQVQTVNGLTTEGVPVDYNDIQFGKRFVRVWHANPNPASATTRVSVARIG